MLPTYLYAILIEVTSEAPAEYAVVARELLGAADELFGVLGCRVGVTPTDFGNGT